MAFILVIRGNELIIQRKCFLNRMMLVRCSLMGFDLNRVWNEPSHWAHPEIYGIKTHIMRLNEDPVC